MALAVSGLKHVFFEGKKVSTAASVLEKLKINYPQQTSHPDFLKSVLSTLIHKMDAGSSKYHRSDFHMAFSQLFQPSCSQSSQFQESLTQLPPNVIQKIPVEVILKLPISLTKVIALHLSEKQMLPILRLYPLFRSLKLGHLDRDTMAQLVGHLPDSISSEASGASAARVPLSGILVLADVTATDSDSVHSFNQHLGFEDGVQLHFDYLPSSTPSSDHGVVYPTGSGQFSMVVCEESGKTSSLPLIKTAEGWRVKSSGLSPQYHLQLQKVSNHVDSSLNRSQMVESLQYVRSFEDMTNTLIEKRPLDIPVVTVDFLKFLHTADSFSRKDARGLVGTMRKIFNSFDPKLGSLLKPLLDNPKYFDDPTFRSSLVHYVVMVAFSLTEGEEAKTRCREALKIWPGNANWACEDGGKLELDAAKAELLDPKVRLLSRFLDFEVGVVDRSLVAVVAHIHVRGALQLALGLSHTEITRKDENAYSTGNYITTKDFERVFDDFKTWVTGQAEDVFKILQKRTLTATDMEVLAHNPVFNLFRKDTDMTVFMNGSGMMESLDPETCMPQFVALKPHEIEDVLSGFGLSSETVSVAQGQGDSLGNFSLSFKDGRDPGRLSEDVTATLSSRAGRIVSPLASDLFMSLLKAESLFEKPDVGAQAQPDAAFQGVSYADLMAAKDESQLVKIREILISPQNYHPDTVLHALDLCALVLQPRPDYSLALKFKLTEILYRLPTKESVDFEQLSAYGKDYPAISHRCDYVKYIFGPFRSIPTFLSGVERLKLEKGLPYLISLNPPKYVLEAALKRYSKSELLRYFDDSQGTHKLADLYSCCALLNRESREYLFSLFSRSELKSMYQSMGASLIGSINKGEIRLFKAFLLDPQFCTTLIDCIFPKMPFNGQMNFLHQVNLFILNGITSFPRELYDRLLGEAVSTPADFLKIFTLREGEVLADSVLLNSRDLH